ncbi:type I phosphodiesterase / nucleotide pyrophosphatase [Nitzschia inconspicua]|uniref:Type I phosphodiesterase / nucleotide pyrophosphatase n=1 Tax=Nitzschia inconspicua TaxID=303405 RepID=A0A9K3LG27_9STRA|nr:type I phosphodiesterase / nucleotide pyrophosphatase [Nitzschia inconspicua]
MAVSHRTKERRKQTSRTKLADLVVPLLAIGGLYWFSASFFLAKRSLPQVSHCDEANTLLVDILGLTSEEATKVLGKEHQQDDTRNGCWMDRQIDSMVILVVDALRFDFARYRLPLSVGARISQKNQLTNKNRTTASQLLQFVADPPTVTMQRLKGLTTGSLPTFADISGNMGGASIEEDSWVEQLKTTPFTKRGLKHPSRLGFVGDDTWVDLFPRQFDESFPFPSFNTRDLDTVDDGCLHRLPLLLRGLRMNGDRTEELEVIVSHFLGVDHVGHTYGPHDKHMTEKLNQMDVALSTTLDVMDTSEKCHLALIFGDHGMTEDGNHGGGTDNEVNAALFVHFSPACGDTPLDLSPTLGSDFIHDAFQSIHQIDLVPTISILLGLPIPYANLGGVVPSLLGFKSVAKTAAALALNAAQVWRYFTVYSETANQLPNLPELKEQLQEAVVIYKEALSHHNDDSTAFYKACGLFKIFLVDAADLGHKVWTRFDTFGMICGGSVLFFTLVFWAASVYYSAGSIRMPGNQYLENGLSAIFVFFHSGILSFSNSYIEAEQRIVMFMLTNLGVVVFFRMHSLKSGGNARLVPYFPILIPLLSRVSELTVSGHGMDPSLRQHGAHSPLAFLSSLLGLAVLRIYFFTKVSRRTRTGFFHVAIDCITLLCIAICWMEKQSLDQTQNGYQAARIAITLLLGSVPVAIFEALGPVIRQALSLQQKKGDQETFHDIALVRACTVVFQLLIAIMVVTGPSTAPTVLIVSIQGWMLYVLAGATGFYEVSTPVQATFWRLLVRHTFFATNHGCAFNRLQYSAAFVATVEFNFALGGLQLFLNTFGWEIVGLIMVWITSFMHHRPCLWTWYGFYQVTESFLNCISVSVLRRHLMVWAVYAPRFLFSSIFLILNCFGQLVVYLLSAFQ